MNLNDLIEKRKKIICTELSPHVDNEYVSKVSKLADVATVTSLKKIAKDTTFEVDAEKESIDKAAYVKKTYGLETIPTVTCRDHGKNNDFLRSLKSLDIHNLLLLYGDPNEPPHKNNYYFKNSGELVKWLREEEASAEKNHFSLCVAGNPASENLEKEIDSLAKKYEAGANVVVTQPVFDVEQGLRYVDALNSRGLKMHVFYGLLLFKTAKSPEFIEKRFGIKIPENVKLAVREKGPEESSRIVEKVYSNLVKHVAGFQIYPYGGVDATINLLSNLRNFLNNGG
ncbi:methylenetetrahydrofolate reductase [Candidatus Micrarchaeota archaeon]|nr:methylenetetrahydrofolate reductase [Candidatus Micrarchaeota archaeon]